jgi:hypothetical protein
VVANVILDISSYQHPTGKPITYAAVAATPVHVIGVVVKATEGTSYVNPYYATDVAGFEGVGIPVIAYHFADFTTARAEAAHFLSVAGDKARVLDSETNTTATWQNTFLAAINATAAKELDYGSASTLPNGRIRCALWVADYSSNPGFGEAWQAGDNLTVAGIPALVDYSVWFGTAGALATLFSTSLPTPAPAPVEPVSSVVTVRFPTDAHGNGWAETTIPWGSFRAATAQGSYPPVDGYWVGRAGAQERTGFVEVTMMDGPTHTFAIVFVQVA